MSKRHRNILFIHSGGVTPVVNTVAHTIFENANQDNRQLYISNYGVDGICQGKFIHANQIGLPTWNKIKHTPGSCFGSSRTPLPNENEAFEPIFKQLDQLKIGTFFCNGGNNSQLITQKMYQASQALGYPLNCIGIPKTIDNDILNTDTCPGFGSAAKYTATSLFEISIDVQAMCHSSTKVIVYEAMGRDAGWLAASAALAKKKPCLGPHIILLPEARFSIEKIMQKTQQTIQAYGHCIIVIAEGANDIDQILTTSSHKSLQLCHLIQEKLKVKTRVVIPDYLQRSARHLCSKTDLIQTIALSNHAYFIDKEGNNGIMTAIIRKENKPYRWAVSTELLSNIAGKVKLLPQSFIRDDALYVSKQCITHLAPLIQGEAFPPFQYGIPLYQEMIGETVW